jgi:hypothetical protein
MDVDVLGRAADCTHWVAVVAVVAEAVGVLVQGCELGFCACATSVEVDAVTDGEILISRTDYGAKSYCRNDCATVRILLFRKLL